MFGLDFGFNDDCSFNLLSRYFQVFKLFLFGDKLIAVMWFEAFKFGINSKFD